MTISMSTENKQLCLALLNAESEQEVINILNDAGYWHDDNVWRLFGDSENNWSQIGNQQGHPVAAMVEKLVNSIDAVLMRECQERGISLESSEAPTPQSIPEALEKFFNINNGNLANIDATNRSELAQNIGFIATGAVGRSKANPNYTVFDRGEGQTPRDMPKTLLSLSKSNKLRIPFVQGKFNMGGTGVLRHGGNHRLQLVISRRCPQIADSSDPTSSYWGFTIVRRQQPPQGSRSSVFSYLAPDDAILTFESDEISMPHGTQAASRAPAIEWGTAIKLYEYNMKGYRTNIKFDLYYALSIKLPKPGLPIRLYEFRKYNQQSPMETLAGLLVRLEDDRGNNLEEGFPIPHTIQVDGEPLKVAIYAFKKDTDDSKYRKSDGIVFTINGQSHGALTKRFFSRQKVRMDYLKDSLLVIVDATGISALAREDLFMNSRDRLSEGDFRDAIEDSLERIVRDDQKLKVLLGKRRREALDEKQLDSKPLKDILDQILKKSKALEAIFVTGKDLSNPFKSVAASIAQTSFEGEFYPSFFELMKRYQNINERPINRRRIRVQFETDVENEYFDRENSPGSLELSCNDEKVRDYEANLLNGVATLNISLPETVQVGDHLYYRLIVTDETQHEPFDNVFEVMVLDPVKDSGGGGGRRLPKVEPGDGDRTQPDGLNLPKVKEVFETGWAAHGYDKYSALSVLSTGDKGYDYFINMDNLYLNHEIKALKANEDPKLLQSKFKIAMVLLGMMMLKDMTKPDSELKQDSDDIIAMSPSETVAKYTSMVAPVILPMIEHLGDLDIDKE